MCLLTQSRFPRLFWAFQYFLGGTADKRRLSLLHYGGHRRVLEVGCSVGNVGAVFQGRDCEYLGVDIDSAVIHSARRRFANAAHLKFLCVDLLELNEGEGCFDYIVFPGVCHHVATPKLHELLRKAVRILDPQGCLVVIDPVRHSGGTRLMDAYLRMDRGGFMRTESELLGILERVPGLTVREASLHPVGATPFSWPVVAQFMVAKMTV